MTFHVTVRHAIVLQLLNATMEGSHAGPITKHDGTCHRISQNITNFASHQMAAGKL